MLHVLQEIIEHFKWLQTSDGDSCNMLATYGRLIGQRLRIADAKDFSLILILSDITCPT
jgi:hypothetical protein